MQIAAVLKPAGAARPAARVAGAQAPWRRRAVVAPAKKQRGGKGFGGGSAPAPVQDPSDLPAEQSPPQVQQEQQAPAVGGSGSGTGSGGGAGGAPAPRTELPAVGRGRIFAVCAQVSLLVAVAGAGLRQVAPAISPAVGDGQGEAVEALLAWATVPGAGGLALAVGVAAAVTAARAALLAAWPEFREASDRSNQQVLGPLGWADLLWVAALPAVSEELLFRGALIPAVYPDWRGVAIAGVAFGVLHNSGGRNPAFAAWASLVGCAYGALFLATGAVACPALAHTLANVASGAMWKAANGSGGGGGGGSGGGSA